MLTRLLGADLFKTNNTQNVSPEVRNKSCAFGHGHMEWWGMSNADSAYIGAGHKWKEGFIARRYSGRTLDLFSKMVS